MRGPRSDKLPRAQLSHDVCSREIEFALHRARLAPHNDSPYAFLRGCAGLAVCVRNASHPHAYRHRLMKGKQFADFPQLKAALLELKVLRESGAPRCAALTCVVDLTCFARCMAGDRGGFRLSTAARHAGGRARRRGYACCPGRRHRGALACRTCRLASNTPRLCSRSCAHSLQRSSISCAPSTGCSAARVWDECRLPQSDCDNAWPQGFAAHANCHSMKLHAVRRATIDLYRTAALGWTKAIHVTTTVHVHVLILLLVATYSASQI